MPLGYDASDDPLWDERRRVQPSPMGSFRTSIAVPARLSSVMPRVTLTDNQLVRFKFPLLG